MRNDMFKVIVERPRSGCSWATKSKLRYDRCADRSHVSGKRLVIEYSGGTKYLNENLAPLKRYLFKQRGRRWNDVFSEICAHLDTGSTVKMHVREHIDDFIMRRVVMHDDGSFTGTSRWDTPQGPDDWWTELYVDPIDVCIKETRALCRMLGITFARDRWKSKRTGAHKQHLIMKRISETVCLGKTEGIWYRFDFRLTRRMSAQILCDDQEIYNMLSKDRPQENEILHILSKQQLSKKQLKTHGLKNSQRNEEADAYD